MDGVPSSKYVQKNVADDRQYEFYDSNKNVGDALEFKFYNLWWNVDDV